MKGLEHSDHKHHEPKTTSRRGFLKSAAAIAASGALVFGTGSLLYPTIARAQVVAGRELGNSVELDRNLGDLDRDSQQYRGTESIPNGRTIRTYTNSASVSNEARFMVTLDHDNVLRQNYVKKVDVFFPRSREADPNVQGAGSRIVDLTDFAAYVRTVANQDMRRVKIYIQTGAYTDANGATKTYTNALFYPLNDNGDRLTGLGSGNHVMFAVSYDGGNDVRSSIRVFHEPNDGRVARR
jgi:hypothetical protein